MSGQIQDWAKLFARVERANIIVYVAKITLYTVTKNKANFRP